MKRIVLFLILFSCTVATRAYDFYAYDIHGNKLCYNIVNGEAQVTGNNSLLDSEYTLGVVVSIPESVTHNGITYPVTSIGDYAFSFQPVIETVYLPKAIVRIGDWAFHSSNLYALHIGESGDTCALRSIGREAFSNCRNFFQFQGQPSVFPQFDTIGDAAFYGCNSPYFHYFEINGYVKYIGEKAFAFCSSLIEISEYHCFNSLTYLGQWAFHGCSALNRFGCYPEEVVIPESLTTIPREAFSFCSSITSVTIPESITSIGAAAFAYCTSLPNVTIPESVTFIDSATFYGCLGLTSMTIPNSIDSIAVDAFWGCANLTFMIIPNSVRGIGPNAFMDCPNLTLFDFTDLNNFTRTYAGNPRRVVKCRIWGERLNSIVQISDGDYSVVDYEDYEEHHVPAEYIPDTNYIYVNNNNSEWEAKIIVLTDCQDAFFTPVPFTAAHAYYTRNYTDGNRSTLYLPFKTRVPNNFGVYEYVGLISDTIHFCPLRNDTIVAYRPYLVGYNITKSNCLFTEDNAEFPATVEDAGAVTWDNGNQELTFHGTVKRSGDLPTNSYGYKDGYFVQSGGSAHVNPFRCFFSYNGSKVAPTLLNVDAQSDFHLGIEDVTASKDRSILYSNDVYDIMGRIVRKNADNLLGLSKGIYIWHGKKQLVY